VVRVTISPEGGPMKILCTVRTLASLVLWSAGIGFLLGIVISQLGPA
jgi:hypothetical protein